LTPPPQIFLDENDAVPWKALKYTAGECNYGGRVTDGNDRTLLTALLDRFYCPGVLEDGHFLTPSGLYTMPPDGTPHVYTDYIESLPIAAPPEVFGLHENANITKDQNDTNALFATIIRSEGGGGGGGGDDASSDATISGVANDVISKVVESYNLEEAALKFPVRREESMNTVLCQELLKFNLLTDTIRASLRDVIKAVQGIVVMSAELEGVANSLFLGQTPAMWKKKSYVTDS